jgi:phosphotransferase system enzyme I (PtsP)
MLTRLREIVEKVASAPRLNEALNILVTDICLAMETEVCSVYLADHDRRCYYLMATRGLKKPRGRAVTLAFDEGIVGLVGRLAEPINLADAQKHPSFKYIPSVKEERFRAFLGVPIIQRRQLLGVLVVQQRELRQYDESEESFLVTLARQMARDPRPSLSWQPFLGSIVIPASVRFRPRRASRLPKAGWMPRSR